MHRYKSQGAGTVVTFEVAAPRGVWVISYAAYIHIYTYDANCIYEKDFLISKYFKINFLLLMGTR
jgi:hypothetical protein